MTPKATVQKTTTGNGKTNVKIHAPKKLDMRAGILRRGATADLSVHARARHSSILQQGREGGVRMLGVEGISERRWLRCFFGKRQTHTRSPLGLRALHWTHSRWTRDGSSVPESLLLQSGACGTSDTPNQRPSRRSGWNVERRSGSQRCQNPLPTRTSL